MKTGKTIVELAQEIERQRTAKQDIVAPTPNITAYANADAPGKVSLVIAPEAGALAKQSDVIGSFPANDLAVTQAAERTGIPIKYVRKMQTEAPQLLAENLNHWFNATPERRLIRTLDGNARAFLSDRYQRIDNADVANATLEVFGDFPGLTIRSTEITENRLYLKATLPGLTREVTGTKRVGDFVEAGVMVTNSEVGQGAVCVSPYALFLVCTNGMVRDGAKRWAHIGGRIGGEEMAYLSDETVRASDKVDLMMIRDTLKHALSEASFDGWLEKIQAITTQRITGDVSKAVEVLGERLLFAETERKTILQNLIEGADLSRFGLMNAITATAESVNSYDRATEIEALGQKIVDLTANDWREIAEAA